MDADFYQQGTFLCIDGPAKKAGRAHSEMKVCFTCRDKDFLRQVIAKIAQDEECYWAKISSKARDGMYLGRCFFTSKECAGQLWARYKSHPRLMVNLQDDDFASSFRASVISWDEKAENAHD